MGSHSVLILCLLALCSCLPSKDELVDPDGDGALYGEDCDDSNAAIYPGADEVWYDDIDNDCDPTTSDDDADEDGYDAATSGGDDCDDSNAAVNPEASDIVDGYDQNCDGVDGVDQDRDGFASEVSGGEDCDDGDARAYPGAEEEPYNGSDDDCDAATPDDDLDGDGYGAVEAGGTDCDDGDASVSPGAEEICGDGVVNDCEASELEARTECGLGGMTGLSDANLKLTGEAANDNAGRSVSSAGDVDGDGRDDLVVGAWFEDGGGIDAGAAYLLLGRGVLAGASVELSLSGADLKLTGEAAYDSAGYSVSGAGDTDGDGRDDLLIGADQEDSGGSDAGAAYLLLGGGALEGASETLSLSGADLKLTGEAAGDSAGYSVSGAGDTDGDGRDDLLVGVFFEGSGGSAAGAVYLLLGGGALEGVSGKLSLSGADLKLMGEAAQDNASRSVSLAGNVDGDGHDDLLVGAPGEDSGGSGAGAVYLLLGGGGWRGRRGCCRCQTPT